MILKFVPFITDPIACDPTNDADRSHGIPSNPVGLNPIAGKLQEPDAANTVNTNPLKQGVLIANSKGIGPVTHEMIRQRAGELAIINGRTSQKATQNDWEQAKRELTGGHEIDPNQEMIESAPESERWDPVHGSTGDKVPVSPSEDEDDEGHSDSARLFEEGVHEAEHDQMLHAAKNPNED